jgi:hypothetical protein
MGDVLVFDLETKKAFQEVGGHSRAADLGVSVAGVYSYLRGQFHTFREEQLPQLQRWFEQADLLIGFNSKSFDNAVLQPYFSLNLTRIPHLDILEEIHRTLGHRLKLDSVAQATLLESKSGDGLEAILMYHRGEWEKLEKYCLQDVKVTRDLYEYGRRHGNLWYTDSGRPTPIPVRWGAPTSIADVVGQAHQLNQHLELEVLGDGSSPRSGSGAAGRTKRTFEVRQLLPDAIRGYDHAAGREASILLRNIFSAKIIGRVAGIQPRLL